MCEATEDGLAAPDASYWDFMAEAEQNDWLVSVSASPFRTCYNWQTLSYEEGEHVISYIR